MTANQPVGHFHGEVAVGVCCCPTDNCTHPKSQWTFYPTDVAQGFAAATCDPCGRPTCTPAQTAEARTWVELYG